MDSFGITKKSVLIVTLSLLIFSLHIANSIVYGQGTGTASGTVTDSLVQSQHTSLEYNSTKPVW